MNSCKGSIFELNFMSFYSLCEFEEVFYVENYVSFFFYLWSCILIEIISKIEWLLHFAFISGEIYYQFKDSIFILSFQLLILGISICFLGKASQKCWKRTTILTVDDIFHHIFFLLSEIYNRIHLSLISFFSLVWSMNSCKYLIDRHA